MPPSLANRPIWVFCDGTSQNAVRHEDPAFQSNVYKLLDCLPKGEKHTVPIYQSGVGTNMPEDANEVLKKLADGCHSVNGTGLHDLVLDMYHSLCHQYDFEGEQEIHLVGFSRGAFAVRALACLIEDVGLLRHDYIERMRGDDHLYNAWKRGDFQTLNSNLEKNYGAKQRHCFVKIASCAVFDTVAAFAPRVGVKKVHRSISNKISRAIMGSEQLTFVKDRVPRNLKHAFQALSLHEKRGVFEPVLWNRKDAEHTTIRQCWFAGDHTDVGGGHLDCGLANITLLWMVAQYKTYFPHINIDQERLNQKLTPARVKYTKSEGREVLRLSRTVNPGHVHTVKLPGQWALCVRTQELKHYNTKAAIGDTIHFTVRLLMAENRASCDALSQYSTSASETGQVAWNHFEQENRGIGEDLATDWELRRIEKWCRREDDLFKKHRMYLTVALKEPGITMDDILPEFTLELPEKAGWVPGNRRKILTGKDLTAEQARQYTLSSFLLDHNDKKSMYDPSKNMDPPAPSGYFSWILTPTSWTRKARDDASYIRPITRPPNLRQRSNSSEDLSSTDSEGSANSVPQIESGCRLRYPTRTSVDTLVGPGYLWVGSKQEDVTGVSNNGKRAIRWKMLEQQD